MLLGVSFPSGRKEYIDMEWDKERKNPVRFLKNWN